MRLEGKILIREVKDNHFLIKKRAYCFDFDLMEKYSASDWHTLHIITKIGRVYEISRNDFYLKAYTSTEFGKNQYILQVNKMQVLKKQTKKSILIPENVHNELKEKAKAKQMTIMDYFINELGLRA